MGAASDGAEIVRLSKEYAEMKPVADAVQALARTRAEVEDLKAGLGMVEEKARMELGMVKPNEIFVQVTPR